MAAELEPGNPGEYPLKPNPWAELTPEALDADYQAYLEKLRDPQTASVEQRLNNELSAQQSPRGPRALESPATPPARTHYPEKGPHYRPGVARGVMRDLRSEHSMDLHNLYAAVNGPASHAVQPQENYRPEITSAPAHAELLPARPFPRRRAGGGTSSHAIGSATRPPTATGAGTALLDRTTAQASPAAPEETMRLRVDASALESTLPLAQPKETTPIGDHVHYSRTIGARILSGELFVDTKNTRPLLFDELAAEIGYDASPVIVPGISTVEAEHFPLPPQFENSPDAPRHRGTASRMKSAFPSQAQTPAPATVFTQANAIAAETPQQEEAETTMPANENTLDGAPMTVGTFAAQFAAKIRAQHGGRTESIPVPDINAAPQEDESTDLASEGAYQLPTTPFFREPLGVSIHEDYPHRQDFITSPLPLTDFSLRINPRITKYAARTSTAKIRALQGRETLPESAAQAAPETIATTVDTSLAIEAPAVESPVEQARHAIKQALDSIEQVLDAETQENLLTAPEDSEFAKLREELNNFRKEMDSTAPAVTTGSAAKQYASIAAMTTTNTAAEAHTVAIEIPRTLQQQHRASRRGIMGLVDRVLRRR